MTEKVPRVALIILDGWGIGKKDENDAIAQAKTPVMDALLAEGAAATLRTDGEHVGLPIGQMGNSEVGHMNIGAGRVVYQDLLRIDRAVADGSFEATEALQMAFEAAREPGRRLHLMGLVSRGGVHSQQKHLHAICEAAQRAGIENFLVHAFTDGRDTAPRKAAGFIDELEVVLANTGGRIASVHGRYFAMDRDNRWARIARSYLTLVHGQGERFETAAEGIAAAYEVGTTDEFIPPFVCGPEDEEGRIRANDVVLCFNFRTDRCREITQALTQRSFPEHDMKPLALHYTTMTNYDEKFKGIRVMYDKPNLVQTLGEVLATAGRTQIRIAETEKYPHVTFFFNGGREAPFEEEKRLMAASPQVATYDLQPEMSAREISGLVRAEMTGSTPPDFICVNFANPDMVGHTGVFDAIVQAVEVTDSCLGEVLQSGRAAGYSFVVIADHGNADLARNPNGTPHTAHTTNPVPVVVEGPGVNDLRDGKLADIAPTVLDLLDLKKPEEMTGTSLLIR